jgi:hypothetical protein
MNQWQKTDTVFMFPQPDLNIFTQPDVKLSGGVPVYINLIEVGHGHKKPRTWRG